MTISHFSELKHASKKVSELEKEIQEQEWQNHQQFYHGTYSVLVYVLLVIVVAYVLYKLYKYGQLRCRQNCCLRALTGPQKGTSYSTDRNRNGNTVNVNISTSNERLAVPPESIPLAELEEVPPDPPRRSLRPRENKSFF